MKRILITGCTGFVGYHLTLRLIENKNKIIGVDNNFRGRINRFSKEERAKFDFKEIDIRNYKDLADCIGKNEKVDAVIHLAYINGTENFYKYPDVVLDVGVRGLINIFDLCKEKNIKELYIASSSEVLGNPKIIPTSEESEINISNISNPRYSYGGGKILYELFGKHYMPDFFSKLILFRPFNVYGPKMDHGHVIPDLLSKIKKMNIDKSEINFEVSGSAEQTRSFEFIDDFVDGFEIVMEKGINREIYNIGNDEEVSIKLLIEKMFKLINPKLKINIIDKKDHLGSPTRRCPDISKLKNLGYKPKINLDKGLRKMITGKF